MREFRCCFGGLLAACGLGLLAAGTPGVLLDWRPLPRLEVVPVADILAERARANS